VLLMTNEEFVTEQARFNTVLDLASQIRVLLNQTVITQDVFDHLQAGVEYTMKIKQTVHERASISSGCEF
jgi:hypothetical protein